MPRQQSYLVTPIKTYLLQESCSLLSPVLLRPPSKRRLHRFSGLTSYYQQLKYAHGIQSLKLCRQIVYFDETDLTDKRGLTESVLSWYSEKLVTSKQRSLRSSLCGRCAKGKDREFGRARGQGGGGFLPYPSRAFCALCAPGIPLPFKRVLRRLVTQLGVLGVNMSIRTSLEK